MSIYVLIIIVSLILSAFFSGMEIAYVSSNKIHIEIEKKQDGLLSKVLTKLTAKPSKFIATMLIGNNIALVIYGFFMGDLLVEWFQSLMPTSYGFINLMLTDFSLISQTIISTLLILITAEFLPKVFFQIYANSLLKILAIPAYVFYALFSLVSDFVIWISDFVLKHLFKTEGDQIQLAFTKVELGHYISEQMESVEEHDQIDSEIQIFQNALEFPKDIFLFFLLSVFFKDLKKGEKTIMQAIVSFPVFIIISTAECYGRLVGLFINPKQINYGNDKIAMCRKNSAA